MQKERKIPVIAIVGTPNVGKSTLINRICPGVRLVVDKIPGSTRDRKYISAEWGGINFDIVDTGGLDLKSKDLIAKQVLKQAKIAVDESTIVLFVVDADVGITNLDKLLSSFLRKSNKDVILVVNKVDDPEDNISHLPFYALSMGEPYSISALHGIGIGELLDMLREKILKKIEIEKEKEVIHKEIKVDEIEEIENSIAIIGKPNVGKSSLFNSIIGEKRAIVHHEPGTTRDAVDTYFKWKDNTYKFIDTAGLRRKWKKAEKVEQYSIVRTYRVLEQSNLSVLVVDPTESLSKQDVKIATEAWKRNCSLIIALNKWDIVDENRSNQIYFELDKKLPFLPSIPILQISAKEGLGITNLLKTISKIFEERNKKISTSNLNLFALKINRESEAPSKDGKVPQIKYITQIGVSPPKFIIFLNVRRFDAKRLKRFLQKKIREEFGFEGTPIRILFRKKT
ncbi:MAG: ribosome biogenesis GTPase Der [Candidatus Humimicrobiia bacterium]